MGAEVLTLVKITDPTEIQEINLQATVKGFYVMGKNLLLWDEGKITFYEIDCPTDSPMTVRMAGTFQAPGVVQAVYSSDNQAIYTLVSDQILIQTHQASNHINEDKIKNQ
jgi:hypothetical protein